MSQLPDLKRHETSWWKSILSCLQESQCQESPPQKNWAMVKYPKLYNEINQIYMLLSKYFILLKYKDIFGCCMTDTEGVGPGLGEVFI